MWDKMCYIPLGKMSIIKIWKSTDPRSTISVKMKGCILWNRNNEYTLVLTVISIQWNYYNIGHTSFIWITL